MSQEDSTASPGSERPRDAREQAAAAAVTDMVDKFTALTKGWLDANAGAFKTSFDTALSPGGYTANELTKDVARIYARNLAFLGSLVQIVVPPEKSQSGSRPPGGSPPSSGQTPPGTEGQYG